MLLNDVFSFFGGQMYMHVGHRCCTENDFGIVFSALYSETGQELSNDWI